MGNILKYRKIGLQILRLLVIIICVGGFIYQAMEFMYLYWTYPTVVDIQQSSPSYLQAPAFTICNPIGYNFTELCYGFEISPCLPESFRRYASAQICEKFPLNCFNGSLPVDYSLINYNKFVENMEFLPEYHDRLRLKLEDYLNCTIEFAGVKRPCNMENIMGSFYTKEELPQYCYTLYSLWGQPNKERERFPKGAIMRLHFFLNASLRSAPGEDEIFRPKHNIPSTPAVQIAVHSPYYLPSPYLDGANYLGGRAYEIRLTMSEKHLLPAPYQTNCTNYFETWLKRGGKAPINQMGVVEECRMNLFYEGMGCVPLTVDYPHQYPICKGCPEDACKCKRIFTNIPALGARWRLAHHDCEGHKFWSRECSTIDIDVLFDRFEITSLTYNPKFESLEIFSVIGGYLGMWLGISLVTVYDFIGSVISFAHKYSMRWRQNKKRSKIDTFTHYDRRYGKGDRMLFKA
ncbi:uncharacterized protein TNIN_266431 [Trichonephila inaurata madagascariensis]|uniref:Uncharacterized protein n=1 Tax=Trichonephila inaurata madagascariensis TaxID=2747483 RepID=A0A8X6M8J2_9ARAC|nr:uncharacterized protein TNIN_266431 [Trichonephila inaurata madagascariensis]